MHPLPSVWQQHFDAADVSCTSLLFPLPALQEHITNVQMCLFFFVSHYPLILMDTVCVCFLWRPSRCLSATLLVRQAEEKLSVFLLHRLQPLPHSCKQVPKMQSAETLDKLPDNGPVLILVRLIPSNMK